MNQANGGFVGRASAPAGRASGTEILQDAVRGVLERSESRGGSGARGRAADELRTVAGWIAESLAATEGEEPARPDLGERPLVRRLTDALQTEVVRNWQAGAGGHSAYEYLRVLAGLQDLRRGLLPDDARSFASRLEDPDGFELLVEVAHDLRSPLTSVSFLAETLREGHSGEINELQSSQLGLIYSAAVGMISVVEDVVELARSGAGLMEDDPEPFSLEEVAAEVRRLVQPVADVKDVEFRTDIEARARVCGHRLALSRVLLNLVTNGLKFTDEGWVLLKVESLGNGRFLFSVRDTGRGIDEQNQATLFHPFRESEGRKAGAYFSGSGLGLSIARRLVRAMGSELEFETEEGWGTRFFFDLELPRLEAY